jgi:hypothetical protein
MVFIATALTSIAFFAWHKSEARPLLAGFLVGIAIASLIEGWCFVSFA